MIFRLDKIWQWLFVYIVSNCSSSVIQRVILGVQPQRHFREKIHLTMLVITLALVSVFNTSTTILFYLGFLIVEEIVFFCCLFLFHLVVCFEICKLTTASLPFSAAIFHSPLQTHIVAR